MPVKIVDLLEEVHIHHDEHQVAMVHLANLRTSSTLVISQHLSGFGRKDLLQVAPVPYSGQHIGKGNLLQFKILPLQLETVPAQRLFLIFQLVFQAAGLVQILTR